jgi:arginyl-tRNA synthetase
MDFGRGAPKGERVMVEYAQPNTHHSFHIGHYRNGVLGEALARLVEFAGFDTLRASYPGDIGLGVITVLWIYDKFYKGQEPDGVHERGQWLLKLYVEATDLLTEKENETPEEIAQRERYDAERRAMLRKWDEGDPYVRELWRETRAWSLEELHDILDMMGVEIDVWFFESEVDQKAKAIVNELIDMGIADDERSEGGAVIVKIDEKLGLEKEKYRTNVILRNDGTTLYLTKDLALAKEKFEKYNVDRSVYVIDVRQSLHMQQTFAILKLMGFPQAEKCYHLGYGFVSLPEGAMSARRGRVVLFKDVADEAILRVLAEIQQKNPEMPNAERNDVAIKVGLGSLAYAMLSVDNNKDIVFDIDEALSFEGHTGPYIQYAHVRASSILRRMQEPFPESVTPGYELNPTEIELIDIISQFPAIVQRAANEYKPLFISNLAYDLARAFNDFYNQCPVLNSEPAVRAFRLHLVAAARQAIANALFLLDIAAPEMM